MSASSAMRWLVGLALLLSGCIVWDDEIAHARAGGVLSKPVVRATISRHREWVVVWGQSETWRLEVEIDGRKYRYGALSQPTDVRISPDRKQVAVLSDLVGTWQRFVPGTTEEVPGFLSLEPEGEPLSELTWPAEHLEPVRDDSWLGWTLAGLFALGVGALVFLRRRRARQKREAEPAVDGGVD